MVEIMLARPSPYEVRASRSNLARESAAVLNV
jgi:hypothetical protein